MKKNTSFFGKKRKMPKYGRNMGKRPLHNEGRGGSRGKKKMEKKSQKRKEKPLSLKNLTFVFLRVGFKGGWKGGRAFLDKGETGGTR